MDVDYAHLPPLLSFDFHTLNGILPLTTSRFDFIGENGVVDGRRTTVVEVNPLPEEYKYFESIGVTEFQAISLVINFYALEESAPKVLKGLPYCVSLLPMTKDNKIDTWNIELLKQFDLRELCQEGGAVFTEFSPFKPWEKGYGAHYSLFSNITTNEHSDSIGFEWGMYFLTPVFNSKEIVIPENTTYSKAINAKYKKYKANRYFKPFTDTKPRQIWGCDSPIELFLLQGLYVREIVPEIQMGFYRSGEIFPNYYRMAESEIFLPEDRLITTADFYYPKHKVAIFCDGKDYHDKEKDQKIDDSLNAIGVKSLRFAGKLITEELEKVLDEIENCLQETIPLVKKS
ncbi:DUF559 domain-containing protein [Gynurincola endophyticus]|uniref:DUF559 domain-containing protein n=1 Tax=Gynurincola endophyticus TaxID=2479004 RepID=UPI0013154583|nr:DUF559 domain-containing protein [Gynurincola endophyticus]